MGMSFSPSLNLLVLFFSCGWTLLVRGVGARVRGLSPSPDPNFPAALPPVRKIPFRAGVRAMQGL